MNRFQRAIQIWSILICAALERKTYTYGQIANILSFQGAGTLSQFLEPIMKYCEQKNYPPLTILIVYQNTGIPGEGLITINIENINSERERVFNFDWFSIEPPEANDLQNLFI